jgi:hypothetical protein
MNRINKIQFLQEYFYADRLNRKIMKKILFISDGNQFPEGAFKFIESLQATERVIVKGMFFTEVDAQLMIPVSYIPVAGPYVLMEEEEELAVNKNSDRFAERCKSLGIRHKEEKSFAGWDKDLFVKESRFADLVVISDQFFCRGVMERQPNLYMDEALRASECPVLVIPEAFSSVERIVVAYDGKKESAFALKQFSNLFPEYDELPIEFVYIKDEETDEIPDMDLLKEYTNAHYDASNITKLHFHPGKSFNAWLKNKKNTLLISGSFSRSGASMLLRRSFVEKIIKNNTGPVFIAHNS